MTVPRGALALATVVASAGVGAAYYSYLVAEPFLPDVARLAPLLWLVASVAGLCLAVMAISDVRQRVLGIVAALLSVPNIALAATFSLGALLGD